MTHVTHALSSVICRKWDTTLKANNLQASCSQQPYL